MYEKGDVKLSLSRDGDEYTPWSDARAENGYEVEAIKIPCVYLPHSCDSWIIGGVQQVRDMIEDLRGVLRRIDGVDNWEQNTERNDVLREAVIETARQYVVRRTDNMYQDLVDALASLDKSS